MIYLFQKWSPSVCPFYLQANGRCVKKDKTSFHFHLFNDFLQNMKTFKSPAGCEYIFCNSSSQITN